MRKAFALAFILGVLGWSVFNYWRGVAYLGEVFGRGGRPGSRASTLASVRLPLPTDFDDDELPRMPAPDAAPVSGRKPASALAAAQDLMKENRSRWGVQDFHELRPVVTEGPMGSRVKYSVYQDGLPIVGMEILVELDESHGVLNVENGYQSVRKVDVTQPGLSSEEAIARNSPRYEMDPVSTAGVSTILFYGSGMDEPELSYVVPVRERDGGASAQIIFRASDGQVLGRQNSRSEF